MTESSETILSRIQTVMEELFELEPETITPEARLYEDLDIDSIDAVDLLIELKKLTGKTIEPSQFKNATTIGDIITIVEQLD